MFTLKNKICSYLKEMHFVDSFIHLHKQHVLDFFDQNTPEITKNGGLNIRYLPEN
ncbi:hypothetical protein XIS1_1700022 [Xenorhabdus innexi]|uniref:Uncharacterized protein n=1 Tax=Xenorhabdus innexi TaxID=290109 RepID=A0A1N6MVX5_9GAMM|nr:hypothetical protein XIS1_1700022 [Xenorhabdus innexi]